MIGYELRPGLAATTALAFSVATQPGLPPGRDRARRCPGAEHARSGAATADLRDPARPRRPAGVERAGAEHRGGGGRSTRSADELWLAPDAPLPRPGDLLLVTDGAGQRAYVVGVTSAARAGAGEPTLVGLDRPLVLGRARPLAPPASPVAGRGPARLRTAFPGPPLRPRRPARARRACGRSRAACTSSTSGRAAGSVSRTACPASPSPHWRWWRPTDPPLFLAATAGRGVFRSADNGTSWEAASDGMTDLTVLALATDGRHASGRAAREARSGARSTAATAGSGSGSGRSSSGASTFACAPAPPATSPATTSRLHCPMRSGSRTTACRRSPSGPSPPAVDGSTSAPTRGSWPVRTTARPGSRPRCARPSGRSPSPVASSSAGPPSRGRSSGCRCPRRRGQAATEVVDALGAAPVTALAVRRGSRPAGAGDPRRGRR